MALSSEERVMCIEEQERTYAVAGEIEDRRSDLAMPSSICQRNQ